MKAVEIIRTEKIGFILAVGGGSVIDGVKFISAAVNFEGDAADILKKRILFKDISKVIPFGTVLTLPATGSEMNSGAVVTIEATQEKLTLGGSALFPSFFHCGPNGHYFITKKTIAKRCCRCVHTRYGAILDLYS
jgi:NADP-dependent alcohol dehydrogenase